MKEIIIDTGYTIKSKTSKVNKRVGAQPDIKSISAAKRQDGARRTKKASPRKRKKNRMFFFAAVLIILVSSVALPLTLFFNMETFEVKGNLHYSSDQIISTANISPGENLFRIRTSKVEERLIKQYPYIESIDLKRVLPTTLRAEIIEATPAYCLTYLGNEMVISSKGKVLEVAGDRSLFRVPQLTGAEVADCSVGEHLVLEDDIRQGILAELIASIDDQNMLDKLGWLDISELFMLKIGYQDRIVIQLGNSQNLSYKLQFAKHIITSKSDTETGVVDVSDTKRASFRPGK